MSHQELTLFDLGVVEPPKTEKKQEEKKEKKGAAKPATAGAANKPAKKVEPIKVQGDWTIHFATESFEVTDFVDEIPEDGVSLDVVREGLERSFPQFSAARTKWDVDKENKRLFPDAFAGSKGAVGEGLTPSFFASEQGALESNAKRPYILSGDGKIFEVRKSVFGTMIAEAKHIPALPNVTESFEFSLPKIPNKILRQIIGFFRSFVSDDSNYEVALRIYWDKEEEQYIIECPEQTVTAVRIELEYSGEYTGRNSLRYVPVLEVHSHNVMRAFFSSVDDADEQAYGIYGVFGRLNRSQIDMIFRVKAGASYVIIPASQIMELEFDEMDFSYPKEWRGKVTVKGGFYL